MKKYRTASIYQTKNNKNTDDYKSRKNSNRYRRIFNMKIIQIGTGGFGKNHARVLSQLGVLSSICDMSPERAEEFGKKYSVNYYTNLDKLLETEKFDAAFVCTPSSSHFGIAKKLLEQKK